MEYSNIKKATFIDRPNRFIANVMIDGSMAVCHVKNTGRCKELLTKGATVFVQYCKSEKRKTDYDLISVYKGDRLINIDSQIPNKVFDQWVQEGKIFNDVTYIKPEYKYGNSRIDFYIEAQNKKILAEVKGATLEKDGVVMFPDAPTLRGVKHVQELMQAVKQGYTAYIVFVVQMSNVKYFTPNKETHPQFAAALAAAQQGGVNVVAVACDVGRDYINPTQTVPIKLF